MLSSLVELRKDLAGYGRGERLLLISFLAFTSLSIIQDSDDLFRVFFFLGMAPATIWLARSPENRQWVFKSPLFVSSTLLMALIYASVWWSDIDNVSYMATRYARWVLATWIFFFCMCLYARAGMHLTRLHGVVLQISLVVAIGIAFVRYVEQGLFPVRMSGLGLLDEIIGGSSLLVMVWIISLFAFDLKQRANFLMVLFSLALLTIYVAFNQTRAALGVVLVCWLALVVMLENSRLRLSVISGALLVGLLFYFFLGGNNVVSLMLDRGDSFRPVIWEITLSHAHEFFWFGIGMASSGIESSVGKHIESVLGAKLGYPHNLFLAMWMFVGIFALLLTFFMFLNGFWNACRFVAGERLRFLLVMIALLGLCMTETARLVASPQVIHLMFWMPLGILCGAYSTISQGRRKV